MVMFAHVMPDWLETLCERGEIFEQRVLAAQLDNLRGIRSKVELLALYDEFAELASKETLDQLREAQVAHENYESTDGEEGQLVLRRLLEYVGDNLEHRAAAVVDERRFALEAELTLDVEGEGTRHSFRSLPLAIQTCADPDRRAALERALDKARGDLAPLVDEAQLRAREAAAVASGFDDYVGWRSRLIGYDIEALAKTAEEILTLTDDLAQDATRWLLRGRIDVSGRQLAQHDLSFAARAVDLDGILSAGELWRVDSFLERLGFEPSAGGRITRDTTHRVGKSSRAYCVALRVPEEIVLVLPNAGGLPQWRALLHELGHALHAATVPIRGNALTRRLGDPSLTEGWAVLLDHLLLNPIWARKVLGASQQDAERVTRTAAAVALSITRRHAAKVKHEIAYHRDDPDAEDVYVEQMRHATGMTPKLEGRLLDIDPAFYCTRYLRAWMFEAGAHVELRERYDEDWFVNPRAGDQLRRLFAFGNNPDFESFVRRELDVELCAATVARRFEEVLG